MKISIIIPVYNCEKYLVTCLESIIAQTYSNWEIILVDDGSSDSSPQICDLYADKYDNIYTTHQSNQGVSAARNEGIKHITGEVVSFVDADDYLDSDMYEILMQHFSNAKIDVVHCGYKRLIGEETRYIHNTEDIYNQTSDEALECLIGGRLFVGSLWNKLYRVELIGDLRFREDIKINEDILFNYQVFSKSKRLVFIDVAKYNYVAHEGFSACFTTDIEKKCVDACTVNKIIYEDIKNVRLKKIAASRYLHSLIDLYRLYERNFKFSNKVRECKKNIWKVYKINPDVNRKMKFSVLTISFCPCLYKIVYFIYDHIRKPNWEV